jgi:hypothetical protein
MMMHGIYWLLSTLPIWATFSILMSILLAIPVGRDVVEGLPYNVSYSSMVGDVSLVVGVIIATTVLQRGPIFTPAFVGPGYVHWVIFFTAAVVGMFVYLSTAEERDASLMDAYHDMIVVPMFITLAITLLPVVYLNGRAEEKWATAASIILWGWLVAFDIKFDRLNQWKWLTQNGPWTSNIR